MTHRGGLDLATTYLSNCDPPYGNVSVLLPAGELLALARRLAIPPQHRHLNRAVNTPYIRKTISFHRHLVVAR